MSSSPSSKLVGVNQWVKSIVNVDSKSDVNLQHLQSILGPIKEHQSAYETATDQQDQQENPQNSSSSSQAAATAAEAAAQNRLPVDGGYFTHEIIFQIEEKMFIESIKFYEKVCTDSSLMRIEALNRDVSEPVWVPIWTTNRPLPPIKKPTVFIPTITPTLFRTDSIKIIISGSIVLIDAIEVKGNKYALDDEIDSNELSDESSSPRDLSTYSALSRNLHTLIGNELFADVYFECEDKIVPAHRNILVSRSEYFRAMLSSKSTFSEATTEHSTREKPIYIKQITYPQFKQVLSYLYTGHIDTSCDPTFLVEIIRVADRMNLTELEQLCLYHISESLNENNVIQVYVEACEAPQTLEKVVQMCYDVIQTNFAYVSRSAPFCSLSQELMLQIIENVVPKLNRLNSEQINNPGGNNASNIDVPTSSRTALARNYQRNDSYDSDF